MKKQISLLSLSVLLMSCQLMDNGSIVPINSIKDPTMDSSSYYDSGIHSINQAPIIEETPYNNFPVQEAPVVVDQSFNNPPVTETITTDVVNTEVKQETITPAEPIPAPEATPAPVENTDVSKTNFGAIGTYKIGNPYLIDGVSYYPHEDYSYSEIGIASWYGPNFHGEKTANGEIFDETKFTAAHRTLPMPSLVKVTNLENGVSINVKVNDRGPYARDRILDLSSAAADILGIKQKGTARVKVEILPEESKNLKELAIASQNTDIYPTNISYSSSAIQPEEAPAPVENTEPAPAPAPVENPEPTPAPEATPAPEENTNQSQFTDDYFVQVAAYSTYEKAEALKDKLVNIGTVKIFKSVVNGNTLYKVRLGEFTNKEDAEKIKTEVDNIGIKGSRVILKKDGAFEWNIK